ncbi:MAG: hypothetical protein J6D09_06815 [Clostridia bacterium]|nr:hypothetical protein [Clostridia bacterium]
MKKLFVALLAMICLFSFVGCGQNDISKYLKKKDGEQYLILPISKEKVYISDCREENKYLKYIDVGLLKKAEKKIAAEVSKYNDETPHYYIDIRDGYLCLAVELIVDLDEPAANGMNHEHVFFRERITKKPVAAEENK